MNLAPIIDSDAVQRGNYAVQAVTRVRARMDSVDLLRGLVMVLMALDHVRDFFGASGMNPRDVADPALFLTRWITHFCAPVFIFLAGMSAYLYGTRGRSTGETSRFLLTRGLWLILIELTIVRLGWRFSFNLDFFVFQVIWVIGASMVLLAALVHLPRGVIAVIGLTLIAGHNLLDGIRAEQFGAAAWVWNFLHQPDVLRGAGGTIAYPLYSLIPWAGVMAAGYALGPVMQLEADRRRRTLVWLGSAVTGGFLLLRGANVYGDPATWQLHGDWTATVLSFINCEKYPPSLLYLMMTLGPALILLAALEYARGRLAEWVSLFGRVPFFYYVAHIYLIHAAAVLLALAMGADSAWLFGGFPMHKPASYGLPLPAIYCVWGAVVVALYPLCLWFANRKRQGQQWWLSYL